MDIWRSRPALRQIRCFVADSFGVANTPAQRPAGTRGRRHANPAGLSAREVEVIEQLAVGRTNRQIAEDLFISPHTVSYHLRAIFAKTGVANRTEAVSYAHRHGLTRDS
jgi:DNA-binding CsgD family transcriptional regulator